MQLCIKNFETFQYQLFANNNKNGLNNLIKDNKWPKLQQRRGR